MSAPDGRSAQTQARAVPCSACTALEGTHCRTPTGARAHRSHLERVRLWEAAAAGDEDARAEALRLATALRELRGITWKPIGIAFAGTAGTPPPDPRPRTG